MNKRQMGELRQKCCQEPGKWSTQILCKKLQEELRVIQMLAGPCNILCYPRNLLHIFPLKSFNGFQLPSIGTGLSLQTQRFT